MIFLQGSPALSLTDRESPPPLGPTRPCGLEESSPGIREPPEAAVSPFRHVQS